MLLVHSGWFHGTPFWLTPLPFTCKYVCSHSNAMCGFLLRPRFAEMFTLCGFLLRPRSAEMFTLCGILLRPPNPPPGSGSWLFRCHKKHTIQIKYPLGVENAKLKRQVDISSLSQIPCHATHLLGLDLPRLLHPLLKHALLVGPGAPLGNSQKRNTLLIAHSTSNQTFKSS